MLNKSRIPDTRKKANYRNTYFLNTQGKYKSKSLKNTQISPMHESQGITIFYSNLEGIQEKNNNNFYSVFIKKIMYIKKNIYNKSFLDEFKNKLSNQNIKECLEYNIKSAFLASLKNSIMNVIIQKLNKEAKRHIKINSVGAAVQTGISISTLGVAGAMAAPAIAWHIEGLAYSTRLKSKINKIKKENNYVKKIILNSVIHYSKKKR